MTTSRFLLASQRSGGSFNNIIKRAIVSANFNFPSINQHQSQTMATSAKRQLITLESMNPNMIKMEYAVRGPLVIRAGEIEKELKAVSGFVFLSASSSIFISNKSCDVCESCNMYQSSIVCATLFWNRNRFKCLILLRLIQSTRKKKCSKKSKKTSPVCVYVYCCLVYGFLFLQSGSIAVKCFFFFFFH